MAARFSLVCTQEIAVDKSKTLLTLSTTGLDGCTHYFQLTRQQFFALDDVITLMHYDRNAQTHLPLGQNVWIRCDHHGHSVVIYRATTRYEEPYFRFVNFNLYIRRVHKHIISFLRSQDRTGSRRTTQGRGLKRRRLEDSDDVDGESSDAANGAAHCERPLSTAMRSAPRSPTIARGSPDGASLQRSTDNAVLPAVGQTSPVLPKRNNSNSGGQYDDMALPTSSCHDSCLPDCSCDDDYYYDEEETDSCIPMVCE